MNIQVHNCCPQRRYSFFNFLVDAVMCCLTYGFWLIWIFVREMRR